MFVNKNEPEVIFCHEFVGLVKLNVFTMYSPKMTLEFELIKADMLLLLSIIQYTQSVIEALIVQYWLPARHNGNIIVQSIISNIINLKTFTCFGVIVYQIKMEIWL